MSNRPIFPVARTALTVIAVVLLVMTLLALSWFAPRNPSAQAQADTAPGTINVSGEALINVVPDEVILTFGVETTDPSLGTAKQTNDQRVQALLALAAKYDIKPEHVKTDYIGLRPNYEDYSYRTRIVSYTVYKSIVFTLKDISKFEALYTDALEVGANYVHGVNFRTTELRKYRDQARDLASRAAREKAVAMAGALDQQVGQPTNIYEEQNYSYSAYGSWWGGGNAMSQNVVQSAPGAGEISEEGGFAPGQIQVSARVRVTFALK